MGNSGSVHNLHNDGVNSEINAYYTQQQYLKRTDGEAKKKHNTHLQHHNEIVHSGVGGSSADRPIAAFKVLPKPTESLKLRATTNGAILHAGGTISFRAKDSLDDKSGSSGLDREEDATIHPMRRSHTLILDSYNESGSHRKSAPSLTEFRRSQTLLHIGYNRINSQENKSSPTFDERKKRLTPQTTVNGTASTLKINKYNKKRKAPPAPIKKTTTNGGSNINSCNILASEAKTTCLAKPRIYTTNSSKPSNPLQQQPHHPRLQQTSALSPFTPFKRGSHLRNSANSQMLGQPTENSSSKVPYRREKSFDAVLLRQRDSNNEYYQRSPVQMRKLSSEQEREWDHRLKIIKHITDSGRARQMSRKPPAKNTPNKISNRTKDLNGTETLATLTKISQNVECKQEEKPFQEKLCPTPHGLDARNTKKFHDNIQTVENHAGTEKKSKVQQQSRIPQLKRTFYFGMESAAPKNPNKIDKLLNGLHKDEETKEDRGKVKEEEEDTNMHTPNIAQMEEIEDNGILVHVRPTLPRRQPETPSFSPAAAWRNLLEEQQRLQHERAKAKQAMLDNTFIETPICLNSNRTKENLTAPITWTPQQDLEDEDEEDEENDEKIKQNDLNLLSSKLESIKQEKRLAANSLHVFSLSLPRDVHLPGQLKSSMDCTDTSGTGLKTNCWLVPGFNSLQKFKTTFSGGVGARLNSKCTCPKELSKRVSAKNSQPPPQLFQTIFGETFTTDAQNHIPECELSKVFQYTPSSHNDNWVLHKSKRNENTVSPTTNSFTTPSHLPANRQSLVYIKPKSLTHVCGGKHVMYLPGQETCNALNTEPQQKSSTATYKRQRPRQRPETARESLQDLTPLQDIQKSNARMPEKNTHRFSFQSTVRVLEKRRLAEKLSKDAEIQEAQRIHELEAMKRVEEDFQRKRAQEKANIRNQLRLHLNSNLDNDNFRSLPLHINDNYEHRLQQSDTNNNIYCRAEPDGAVSPSPIFNDIPDKSQHYNFPLISPKTIEMRRSDSDCEESELDTQLADFQRTALLIEPYLQSII